MALIGKETQGTQDLGPDVGYNPVQIPKRFANVQLDLGCVQSVENQRVPMTMGGEFMYYDPEGSDKRQVHSPRTVRVVPTPGGGGSLAGSQPYGDTQPPGKRRGRAN